MVVDWVDRFPVSIVLSEYEKASSFVYSGFTIEVDEHISAVYGAEFF